MTQPRFTPGPWKVAQYENFVGYSIWAESHGAGCIAERWYPSERKDAPILENARLIAAAPDMYAALQLVAEAFVLYSEDRGPIGKLVLAALAKADGKESR